MTCNIVTLSQTTISDDTDNIEHQCNIVKAVSSVDIVNTMKAPLLQPNSQLINYTVVNLYIQTTDWPRVLTG